MRKLMWFSIGAVIACAAGAYWISGLWLLVLALFCLACAAALAFRETFWQKAVAVVLFGCVAGFLWMFGYDMLYIEPARKYDGQTVTAAVTISDHSYETSRMTAADAQIKLDGKIYRIKVYLDKTDALKPGDRVEGRFQLQYTAGIDSMTAHYQGKGIFLVAFSEDPAVITRCAKTPLRFFAANLRREITNMLNAVFPNDTVGFARALLLGDSSLLTYQQDTDFRTSGIRHVIAVSGLHVSILFSLVYLLSGRQRWLTALVGIPVLLLFAAVAGFTPSINRACIMQVLMILALLCNREYDPPTALAFAVLVMLAANPLTVTSVSFQLSVGCMVGIFLFSERISAYIKRKLGSPKANTRKGKVVGWFAGSVSVTLSAMVVTTPLCAVYFESVSLIGVLTNLFALWIISFVFYGIMLACLAGMLWLPAGRCIAWLISWPIRYVLTMAKLFGSVPFAAVYTCSVYIVAWLIFSYILFAVFLCWKKKRPVLLAAGISFLLVLCVLASWLEPRMDHYRLTVLDVGQGQCILLQTNGKTYMVDCGGDTDEIAADTAAAQLLSQGITSLDGIIITHYDRDHVGGLELLLSRIPAEKLYLPDVPDDNGIKEDLAAKHIRSIQWIQPETVTTIEEAQITVFAPEKEKIDNESSLCVLFQPKKCDILITGDRARSGEQALMEQTTLPDLEVLVAGHHGSAYSTGLPLLKYTTPDVAIISVGKHNSYGHPSEETLDRLLMFNCRILRTDLEGTIVIRG